MLCAYYSKGCNSRDIFDHLKIAESDVYEEHLNGYNVIHLNMQHFLSDIHSIEEMIALITEEFVEDLDYECSISVNEKHGLPRILSKTYLQNGMSYIFAIDEWDCIFRE